MEFAQPGQRTPRPQTLEGQMSILDDLFTKAQALYSGATGTFSIYADVGITTNVSKGLSSAENIAISWPTISLVYNPGGKNPVTSRAMPAYFSESGGSSGPAVTITQPQLEPSQQHYEISIVNNATMLNLKFSPSVDASTNILWGHSGATFITVSLCNLRLVPGSTNM
jgi:hypothetical protein